MEFSKEYEQHGGRVAVNYTIPPVYRYDAIYTEYAHQQAAHEFGCNLYAALMHTKQPAVIEIIEHSDEKYEWDGITSCLTIDARITPVETHRIVMPGCYEPSYHYIPPSVRTAIRYWLDGIYKKLQHNWRQR